MRYRAVFAPMLVLGTLLLAGCGQKGPLTLTPTRPAAGAPASATTSTSAPAPTATPAHAASSG